MNAESTRNKWSTRKKRELSKDDRPITKVDRPGKRRERDDVYTKQRQDRLLNKLQE